MSRRLSVLFFALAMVGAVSVQAWEMKPVPIQSRWAKEVRPDNALPEYPRPQFARPEWQSLNGLWDYAIIDKNDNSNNPNLATRNSQLATNNDTFKADGEILVPFSVESALSGVQKLVNENQKLVYNRKFTVPEKWTSKRIVLNFEACDWQTKVYVNGKLVGEHTGGYAPFSFDITDALNKTGEQNLRVVVYDPTDANWQPCGKQTHHPHDIWHIAVTGLWGSVWLEPVAREGQILSAAGYAATLQDGKLTPVLDGSFIIKGKATVTNPDTTSAVVTVYDQEKQVVYTNSTKITDSQFTFTGKLTDPKFWEPGKPYLYTVVYEMVVNGKTVDRVESYIGLRTSTIGIDPTKDNHVRLLINGKFVFQYGPLDQGRWPAGLYTAPTDEALKFDLEMTQKMGFNMLRKHVKVEPRRFYYHCDKMGLLVWQDMPTGDKHISPTEPDIIRCKESADNYYREWAEIMATLQNSPSIVVWIPFNEGWGQFQTEKVAQFTKDFDPTRVVDCTSGWAFRPCGEVHDVHHYQDPIRPENSDKYALVLGEFGGLGYPVIGHSWVEKDTWRPVSEKHQKFLLNRYEQMMNTIRGLIDEGLSAAVYTMTTDVEVEYIAGMFTFDREVHKIGVENIAEKNKILYEPKKR